MLIIDGWWKYSDSDWKPHTHDVGLVENYFERTLCEGTENKTYIGHGKKNCKHMKIDERLHRLVKLNNIQTGNLMHMKKQLAKVNGNYRDTWITLK